MNAKVLMAIRILLGLFMLIFGLNKFLSFLPVFEIPGDGGTLMGIYFKSGFLNIIGVIEVLGGLCLILNKYVPLAVTFIIAVMFNATVFHALHDMANIGPALVGLLLGLAIVFGNKDRFVSLLSP